MTFLVVPADLAGGPPCVSQQTETSPGDVALLRQMRIIRGFEEAVMRLFERNLVRGSTHLCNGQEAVTVGVSAALRRTDAMTCSYRGHGAVLAKGADLAAGFAEILGRDTGMCRGRGGSMHLTDLDCGALGSNAIVGAQAPIALGAAYSAQVRGTDDVAVTYFGDGAFNIGAIHESLNMAQAWRLPVVFVVENNKYGEYSPVAATTRIVDLVQRVTGYGMPGVRVDGNDVVAVRAVAQWAVARARAGQGPALIEADTYRLVGHSRSDPGAYRPAGELERWRARDPIVLLREALIGHGHLSAEQDQEQVAAVADEIEAALERALGAPEPDPATLLEGVWA